MRVGVNVLNWRRRDLSLRCLERLAATVDPTTRLRLIDNGSQDGTPEAVRDAHPEVEVIALGANLGFAGGHNRGLARAFADGDDAVLLFNNDAEPEPGFLEPLVRACRDHPDVGAVSPKIVLGEDHGRLWYAGGRIDWWRGLAHNVGAGEADDGRFDRAGETGYATGCAMLITRNAWERVGAMEDAYFLYLEDVEWSVRARRAGLSLRYEPASRIAHASGTTSGGFATDAVQYYFARNRIRLLRKHGRWYHWPTFAPFYARHTTAHAWRALRAGSPGRARALARATRDAIVGRGGRWQPPPRAGAGASRASGERIPDR